MMWLMSRPAFDSPAWMTRYPFTAGLAGGGLWHKSQVYLKLIPLESQQAALTAQPSYLVQGGGGT